jgi:hypothetical protein
MRVLAVPLKLRFLALVPSVMNPVVTVVPISVVMTPSPIAWRPSVIRPSAPISRTMDVVRTIRNRDRDRAWISIARVSAITRSIPPITSIIRSVARITSIIIISASASSESHKKQKEEESRPFRSRLYSSVGGGSLRLGVIDNI